MSKSLTIFLSKSDVPEIAYNLLKNKCQLVIAESDRQSILNKIQGVDALFWATHDVKIDKEILDKAGPQCKVIGTMSVGLDHIDLNELKKRGIKLGNTAGVLDDATSSMAVTLALAASRRLHEGRLHIENSTWNGGMQWMLGRDIAKSTVGIVGLGRIGQAVVSKLKAFNVAKFLYSGHKEKQEGKALGAIFVSLDTLVKESDFIIASCPLTPETEKMFNSALFAKMKNTAVFVNISRGAVVDQPALIDALKNNVIFSAGLDVMTPEPLPNESELLKLPNCVLTPHLGSATVDTRAAMAELTAMNILRGLGGEEMISPVNL